MQNGSWLVVSKKKNNNSNHNDNNSDNDNNNHKDNNDNDNNNKWAPSFRIKSELKRLPQMLNGMLDNLNWIELKYLFDNLKSLMVTMIVKVLSKC